MRETRSSGSVEGVMSNRDPYSDFLIHIRAFPVANAIGKKISLLLRTLRHRQQSKDLVKSGKSS
jgi:hypothetical protein